MHAVQKSFWDYFWLTKFYLRAAGILPFGGSPSLWKSILSTFLAASPILYSLYVTVPEINYVLFRSHTVDDMLEAVIIAIAALSGQFRSIFVIVHREEIVRLFSICREIWDNTVSADRKVTMIWAKRAKLYSMAYFWAAQGTVTLFVLNSTIKQLSAPDNSTTRYYPFRFKEDSIPSPEYEIKYTLQVVCCYFGVSFIAASDVIGTLLALNMCGQLALIKDWLLTISKEKPSVGSEKHDFGLEKILRKCIRRHQVVLNFCCQLEEVVNQIYLIQIITGLYIIGIAGSRLTENMLSYRYVGGLMFAITGIFCSCLPAENLSTASVEVAQAVYEVPWHSGSHRARTSIAIMLARSNRPARLTAGKFVVLSLETFLSIVYKGLSFCMVLNKF